MMKQQSIVPFVAIGLFLLPIIAIIVAAIMKSLKGKVHFEIPRPYIYGPGEKVSGTLVITPKKSLTADRVTVWLRCFHRQGKKGGTHGDDRPSQIVHYETSIVLGERISLRAGMPTTFPFELPLPQSLEIPLIKFPETAFFGKTMNNMLASGMKSQLKEMEWQLHAEAEMDGLDLEGKTPLNVELPANLITE